MRSPPPPQFFADQLYVVIRSQTCNWLFWLPRIPVIFQMPIQFIWRFHCPTWHKTVPSLHHPSAAMENMKEVVEKWLSFWWGTPPSMILRDRIKQLHLSMCFQQHTKIQLLALNSSSQYSIPPDCGDVAAYETCSWVSHPSGWETTKILTLLF